MKVVVIIQIIKWEIHIVNIRTLGIDLGKDVFQLHGTDAKGNRVLTKRLSRAVLM